MLHPTIDREDVLEFFQEFMQPQSPFRVLRLLGDAKLGKTHLLTKVLPAKARNVSDACAFAILDLRSEALTVPEILHNLCAQLPDAAFSNYRDTYQKWQDRPKIDASGLQAVLSILSIKSRSNEEDTRSIIPELTRAFVSDLRSHHPEPVLLLFDAVNDSAEHTRTWLMDMLLVQLAPLEHIRVVIAGRDLPDAAGTYAAACRSYELLPVDDVNAYIRFCQESELSLVEQSIRDFAHAVAYSPGLFVELAQPFRSRSASHGR